MEREEGAVKEQCAVCEELGGTKWRVSLMLMMTMEYVAPMSQRGLSLGKTASKNTGKTGGGRLTVKFHMVGDSSPCHYLAKAGGTSASRSQRCEKVIKS